jgi:hypothetical protein
MTRAPNLSDHQLRLVRRYSAGLKTYDRDVFYRYSNQMQLLADEVIE